MFNGAGDDAIERLGPPEMVSSLQPRRGRTLGPLSLRRATTARGSGDDQPALSADGLGDPRGETPP